MSEPKKSRSRAIVGTLIVVCVLYFLGGGVGFLLGWVPLTTYTSIGGIVGGFASVLGLVSLAKRPLSVADIKEVELESLRSLAETTERLEKLKEDRVATQEELRSLEDQKEQMGLLVRKASLSLFLQEQRNLYEQKVLEQIESNHELKTFLSELADIDNRMQALGEEIEQDPNVSLLEEIVESARKKAAEIRVDFSEYPPFTRAILQLTSDTLRSFRRLHL